MVPQQAGHGRGLPGPGRRPARRSALKVELVNRQRRFPVDRRRVCRAARNAWEAGGGAGPSGITVLFAGDRRIRDLNRRFREVDRPTDVLSFPDGATEPGGGVHVGDIAISLETAQRQAVRSARSLAGVVDRLVVHGVLHLLGYDHETDDGEMMALQGRILRSLRSGGRS